MTEMTDLRDRFHRVDRLRTPDLWPEVMERASSVGQARAGEWQPAGSARVFRLALLTLLLVLLATAAIAVVGSLLITPRPTQPASGWIAYTLGDQLRADRGDIYLTRPDGSPRLLVGAAGDQFQQACPAFSPDGRHLAYAEKRQSDQPSEANDDISEAEVVIVEVEEAGTLTERLRMAAGRTSMLPCPRWSPDSSAVAFIDGLQRVLVQPLDGPLAEVAVDRRALSLSWTHDSAAIAVLDDNGWIRIVPTGGGAPRVLDAALTRGATVMSASPAGPALAIGGDETWDGSPNWGVSGFIRVIDYEAGRVILEEASEPPEGWWRALPAWSPDGTRIAWYVDDGIIHWNRDDAIAVRAISGSARTMRHGPWRAGGIEFTAASGVTWSADGTRLLFVAIAEGSLADYAYASVMADGPAVPQLHSPWTDDLYWQDQTDVTWQSTED